MDTPCLTRLPDVAAQQPTECDWQRLLQQERRAHHDLAEADGRKDEFLAMLGHELRNPLSDIVSAIQVLEQQSCCDPADAEMHGVIKRQTLHMTKMVDDLLDISRIACGKIVLQLERLDLVALTRNAISDHQHHLDASRLTLIVELPDAPIWMMGDVTRLSQVITNLLQNAMKFTDPGGSIWVCVSRGETSAVVSVRDSGIGIATANLAAMFEPFRQAEISRARSRGGLGLGLALSRRFVEEHEGAITAASEGLGRGSVFSVRLPLSRVVTPAPPQPTTHAVVAPLPHRVLIVDDRRDARLVLATLLMRMGQLVTQAENGAAAIVEVRSTHPQVVFCDIGLPDMDGYAVARVIRADPSLNDIMLVALTGYGQAEDRDLALRAGFDQHLTKPVSDGQLRDLLLTCSRTMTA